MRALFLSLTIVIFGIHISSGQSTLNFTNPDLSYREGISLMNQEKYLAAANAFNAYLEVGQDPVKLADAQYYQAFCAVQLRNEDGEMLIEQFITEHPNHAKASLAYYELASLKYSEKNYRAAIEFYEKCYLPGLSEDMRNEARFKLAYAYFTQKKFDEAYELFSLLKREENNYKYPASYYAGYLNFHKGEYDRAFYDLTRAEENSAYAPVIPSMLVKVYYKQKRYDDLINYGKSALNKREVRDKPEINLYLGEAYFEKKDFASAATYYNDYLDGKRGNVDRDLLFRIGYVQMYSGEQEAAIESFKNVALKSDTLGYIASYYLGNLYVETDNKNYAISAFKISKDNSYDDTLEEESLFQYAKLNLDLGNFEEAISSIQEYKSKYPGSDRLENIDEILTEAYLNSRNYDLALQHIENMSYRSDRINRAYQQIAFFKGTELFNDAKFYQAVQMFDRSLQQPISKDFVVKANYWKGEAYSVGLKYEDAVNAYAAVFRADPQGTTETYLPTRYGIGYAYYNLKEYTKALDHFRYYVGRTNALEDQKHRDALVRLGDCFYATKMYDQSLEVFDRAIALSPSQADYCYFRKGVVNGIMGNMEAANSNFDKVIRDFPESRHMPNTLYQKGQFNFENGSYTFAINVFDRLISNYPESNYVPYALQSRAIAASNLKKYQEAQRDYQVILEKYPGHEIANSALLGLQEILLQTGNSEEFDDYLALYRNANPESSQLESIEYEAAKAQYFNQNYLQAISAFNEFLNNYPNTAYKTESIYLKADAYYRSDQHLQALDNYYLIVQDLSFNRHNRVVQRIAEIELSTENYEKSIPQFEHLEKIASSRKEQYVAWNGLMQAHFQTGNYEKAIEYGTMILEKGQVATNAKNEALLLIAKSHMALGDRDQAREFLEETVQSAKDEHGAEALFMIAQLLHDNDLYQKSIDRLFELNNNYSMYEYWLGRSFILIGDNYLALGEDFQAKATYQSVVDNSPMGEIVDEAELKLMVLEQKAEEMSQTEMDTLEVEEIENR
jgi:tetratricopeptide (TPR) repeat protein